jgi:hypothetical protein
MREELQLNLAPCKYFENISSEEVIQKLSDFSRM